MISYYCYDNEMVNIGDITKKIRAFYPGSNKLKEHSS